MMCVTTIVIGSHIRYVVLLCAFESQTEAGLLKCALRASTKSLYDLKVCGSKLAHQELALPVSKVARL